MGAAVMDGLVESPASNLHMPAWHRASSAITASPGVTLRCMPCVAVVASGSAGEDRESRKSTLGLLAPIHGSREVLHHHAQLQAHRHQSVTGVDHGGRTDIQPTPATRQPPARRIFAHHGAPRRRRRTAQLGRAPFPVAALQRRKGTHTDLCRAYRLSSLMRIRSGRVRSTFRALFRASSDPRCWRSHRASGAMVGPDFDSSLRAHIPGAGRTDIARRDYCRCAQTGEDSARTGNQRTWEAIMLRRLTLVVLTGFLVLLASPAYAAPTTTTTTEKGLVETFVDVVPTCEDGGPLYTITTTSNLIEHETAFDDGRDTRDVHPDRHVHRGTA